MFSYSILKHYNKVVKQPIRFKNPPNHWSVVRKKVHPVDKALNHFDDFYKQVFSTKWESIREGLLGKHKYVAVINNYGDDKETMEKLELNGAINVRTLFKLEKGYIQEKVSKSRRSRMIEKVLKNDRISEKIQTETNNNDKNIKKVSHSLESSLKEAEYDTTRIIDPNNPLSSEILHEFVPATKIKGKEDFILESDHYKLYDQDSKFAVKVEREYDVSFPNHLNIYCYEAENDSNFDSPKRGSLGVLNYYLMDGSSILPVLALDLQPGHKMLDMCAAPGGKSLLALQTLYPDCILSNDTSKSRLNRIRSVFEQFLYDFEEKWIDTGKVKLSNNDGRFILEHNFDRILVDVPCTTDRHSLHENDNNLFKSARVRERLELPKLQRELLVNALKLVRKGGVVVYSTCSLSPIQNDGVVHMALKQIWEETNMEIVVKDLSPALLQCRSVFQMADKKLLRYGHLVLPCRAQNYGPTYFCKLQKIK